MTLLHYFFLFIYDMKYSYFASDALDKLKEIQNMFMKTYSPERYSKWFYNQSTELLRLYNDDEDQVYFKHIPIGTFSSSEGTWMWSWYNSHSHEQSKNDTLEIKGLESEKGLKAFGSILFSR